MSFSAVHVASHLWLEMHNEITDTGRRRGASVVGTGRTEEDAVSVMRLLKVCLALVKHDTGS